MPNSVFVPWCCYCHALRYMYKDFILFVYFTTNNREVSHQYENDNDNEHVITL
jgi:hypothetical protein